MKNIFLIGGGGHCRSCIDVIEQSGEFQIKGVFDQAINVGQEISGYKIIGSDLDLSEYVSHDNYFLITIGQIKTAEKRIKIFNHLKDLKAQFAVVVSSRAYVSPSALIGEGTIVLHDALVNAHSMIGENCIVNTKALIEHDAKVADHCHISTASVVNGGCIIEEQCFIGSNAILKHGITVPAKSIIQAGSYSGK